MSEGLSLRRAESKPLGSLCSLETIRLGLFQKWPAMSEDLSLRRAESKPLGSLCWLGTIRLGLSENGPAMSEGLSLRMAESNGSKGRTRTYNHTVNSRVLYH